MLCCTWSTVVFALLLITGVVTDTTNTTTTESCSVLYEKGVEAYLENRFEDCVTYLEAAIENYRTYTKKLQNCRLLCKEEAENSEPLYSVDVENLRFYEKAIRNTLCLIECQKKNDVFDFYLNTATTEVFENRKPYEYLHICYFQVMNDCQTMMSLVLKLYDYKREKRFHRRVFMCHYICANQILICLAYIPNKCFFFSEMQILICNLF